ncbi:MAG: cellulase family glycosylhydrolase [Micromonosporaceae bacterium]|nr:cellulase family glycosylhydrolase [Micromonosporaceae bacterium]
MTTVRVLLAFGAALVVGGTFVPALVNDGRSEAHAAESPAAGTPSTDVSATGTDVSVASAGDGQGWVFRDQQGREVTLRGFNVAGSTKLRETGLLPFKTTAEAAASAQAMRDLTGANVIRFLISWEGVQPAPDRIDEEYLDRAAAQISTFTDRGIRVLLDYHQDLYAAALFNAGSWYTGDGAPAWVIQAGGYPKESCGICLMWGQNMLTNTAVRRAAYDFWHNRALTTSAGEIHVQDAFLQQAGAALAGLAKRLPAASLNMIIGVDPFNEPFDGGLDSAAGTAWEKDYVWPFYQRFRSIMDDSGWADKPAFIEPLVFWNTGVSEQGGMTSLPPLGTDYVFNAHYYDGLRMTINPGSATDGSYSSDLSEIRDRAASLATAPFVSEFGNALSGTTSSSRTPWMIRAMYQALDSRLSGAEFFTNAASAGPVLSATQWHWDTASGRHAEAMNGNQTKIQTEGDAWNDEDHSVVATDDSGAVVPRLDIRVLDRLYPSAVSGHLLAFGYEDLARSGYGGTGTEQAWLTVPASLPALASLVRGRQYGVLVWRESGSPSGASTELHLPALFPTASTVVVSDVATALGPAESGRISVAREIGSETARRLMIDATGSATGTVHVALVVNAGSGEAVTADQLAAARAEVIGWTAGTF